MPLVDKSNKLDRATSDVRLCNRGYSCGDTCISKKKVCLKKLGSNRANEIARRFSGTINLSTFDKGKKKSTPDLVSDV